MSPPAELTTRWRFYGGGSRDEFAEKLYARSISILCTLDRADAARRLLDRLEDRLRQIGEEPLPATTAPLARLLAGRRRIEEARLRPAGA